MKREIVGIRLIKIAVVLLLLLPLLAVAEVAWPNDCISGENNGEKTLVCIPKAQWNGDLVVYAHGYVAPHKELALPIGELTLDDGTLVPEILMENGYAFATTSFSTNGYAIKEGVSDINALVEAFKTNNTGTNHVLVVGASEGGLIATMLIEKYPEIYDGGLALCGPLAGIPYQIRYMTDFRVVFDHFYKDVFNFGAVDIPEDAVDKWDVYKDAIERAILDNNDSADQLFDVVGVARGSTEDDTIEATQEILAYNITGFNDVKEKAGGNPYVNLWKWYMCSGNDLGMNQRVERIKADKSAEQYVKKYYKPTGDIHKPLVTLHTTEDPIVPYRHEFLYSLRAERRGKASNLVTQQAFSYGHCNFTAAQVMGSFGILVWMSTRVLPSGFEAYLK